MAKRNNCRSCGASILWAMTPTGKRMPLDQTPHESGNVELCEDGTCRVVPKAVAAECTAKLGTVLHRSHFVTCPNADRHRKFA